MARLAAILFSIIGTSTAGTFMIAALVMGYDTARPIIIAVSLGVLVAVPITWLVSKAIIERG
ncbi:CTP synthetase [Thalassorhabdomicrobium marinisediminis]|uniref:CTP synthetase n=1 Tax=Thalassorhabdomicrobium marinisediminis TaxID=2170577 RepID=A0A2T7FWY4_9RHOB|nr:CTP synthetase [Thalassorhabdomicrobium marinisediminis]PVA06685.1 CTP synthetase [Thalassorhabdomicrobium marinisediminis]